jgi:hypothetical protein
MKRAPETDVIVRLKTLCLKVGRAIHAAAADRKTAGDAFALLKNAQRKSTRFCEEVDKLLPVRVAPRRAVTRSRRGKGKS